MESAISTILSSIITLYIPIAETGTKIAISLAISQILTGIIMKVLNKVSGFSHWWNRLWAEKIVYIDPNEAHYISIIEYLYSEYCDMASVCKFETKSGKNRLVIEMLNSRMINEKFECNGQTHDIKIKLRKHTKDPKMDRNGNKFSLPFDHDIVFSTKGKMDIIEKYIDNLINKCNKKSPKGIHIYKLSVGSPKDRFIEWIGYRNKLSKLVGNTIASKEVQEKFYDDIKQFVKSDEEYVKKGKPYKRNYILYGEPGCGKSSMIAAVANEYHMPIFLLDLSILNDNNELNKAIDYMRSRVSVGQKHMLVFEDIDRTGVFNKESDSKITENCLLNILEGIEEYYGRITILTTNRLDVIDNIEALIRPGRVDQLVHTTYCDTQQVANIIKLHTGISNDSTEDLKDQLVDIKITPAKLVQILQLVDDPDKVVQILQKIKDFSTKEAEKLSDFSQYLDGEPVVSIATAS